MMNTDAFITGAKINSCAKVYCPEDWSWDTRKQGNFSDFDLWTVLSGRGVLTSKEGSYPIQAGDSFFLRPQEHYAARHDASNPLTVIYIHFNSDQARGEDAESFPLYRHIQQFDQFEYLLEKVVLSHAVRNEAQALCWLRAVLYEVFEQDEQLRTGALPGQRSCVGRICEEIQKNPGGIHRLADFARAYNYSSDHLGRVFKACLGVSFSQFLVRTRIDYAKFLLRTSEDSIAGIADFLGYTDSSFFTKQYLKYEGMTPSRFRALCRGRSE